MPGSTSKLSEKVRAALVPTMWALMLTVWLSALLRVILGIGIMNPQDVSFPVWLMPVLFVGASALENRLRDVVGGRVVAMVIGLVLVVMLVIAVPLHGAAGADDLGARWQYLTSFREGFPALLVVFVTAAGLWAAGLAVDWSDQGALWRGFVAGIATLGLAILLPEGVSGQSSGSLTGSMALLLFSGLVALALQSLTNVLAMRERRGGGGVGIERYWLLSLGLVTLGIILAGAIGGLLLSPDTVTDIAAAVWPVIRIILTPIWFLFQWVGYILIWFVNFFVSRIMLAAGREGQAAVPEPEIPRSFVEQLDEIGLGEAPPPGDPSPLGPILLAIIVVVGIAALFYAVWRRRRPRRQGGATIEDRESILTRDMLMDQVREWLGRLRPGRPEPLYDDELSDTDPRQIVRALYRRLLQAAVRMGRPRSPGQTPESYGRSLQAIVPREREHVAAVTERYVAVRYGDKVPTPEEVAEARASLERVEQAIAERRGQA